MNDELILSCDDFPCSVTKGFLSDYIYCPKYNRVWEVLYANRAKDILLVNTINGIFKYSYAEIESDMPFCIGMTLSNVERHLLTRVTRDNNNQRIFYVGCTKVAWSAIKKVEKYCRYVMADNHGAISFTPAEVSFGAMQTRREDCMIYELNYGHAYCLTGNILTGNTDSKHLSTSVVEAYNYENTKQFIDFKGHKLYYLQAVFQGAVRKVIGFQSHNNLVLLSNDKANSYLVSNVGNVVFIRGDEFNPESYCIKKLDESTARKVLRATTTEETKASVDEVARVAAESAVKRAAQFNAVVAETAVKVGVGEGSFTLRADIVDHPTVPSEQLKIYNFLQKVQNENRLQKQKDSGSNGTGIKGLRVRSGTDRTRVKSVYFGDQKGYQRDRKEDRGDQKYLSTRYRCVRFS